MSYKVTAPLVIIAHEDGKTGDWYGYAGAIVPGGYNDKRCKVLAKEGFLEVVKADPEPAKEPTSVEDILGAVGDDKAKATEALEIEKAGKNRPTLVAKLEAIVSAS
ncbi:MAG TPA: hypothetical protein VLI04_22200 [Nocardioidaceae bacterium]|nr:hypothetical protein [Nocardioidaceae bacterium]